jgi:hypothetical protein
MFIETIVPPANFVPTILLVTARRYFAVHR